jgi:hypothetical protein
VKTTRAARVSVWGLLVAGAMMASAPAQAALTVTTTGEADFVGGYRRGLDQRAASYYEAGGGGIFTFNRTGGTAPALMPDTDTVGKFVGICLEFSEAYTPTGTYTFVGLESAPVAGPLQWHHDRRLGTYGTRADDLRRFLGPRLSSVRRRRAERDGVAGISRRRQAPLAVQLVVWEIASETYLTTRPYSLSTIALEQEDLFRVRATGTTPTAARNQAIAWLNGCSRRGRNLEAAQQPLRTRSTMQRPGPGLRRPGRADPRRRLAARLRPARPVRGRTPEEDRELIGSSRRRRVPRRTRRRFHLWRHSSAVAHDPCCLVQRTAYRARHS